MENLNPFKVLKDMYRTQKIPSHYHKVKYDSSKDIHLRGNRQLRAEA